MRRWMFCALLFSLCASGESVPRDPETFRAQVETDWRLQEQNRGRVRHDITPEDDARGGCDGVIDGKWGFHTEFKKNSWWQVDLGRKEKLGRIVLWNRCDAASRASHLKLLLSGEGMEWRVVYTHDGTPFFGFTDHKPLVVDLTGDSARYLRVQLPGSEYLHLDEVEIFSADDPRKNLALNQPAKQSSTSTWSADHSPRESSIDWARRTREVLERGRAVAAERAAQGIGPRDAGAALAQIAGRLAALSPGQSAEPLYIEARWILRALVLSNPLLDFDALLFAKRVPGSFNHMSDQYYGWWSRPGGGLFALRHPLREDADTECLSESIPEPGSFLRPTLSFDGRKALFARCTYYPGLAEQPDKLNKANVPEEAFYHLFEMDLGTREVRQLTHGKYDDIDARYLPDGRIVFLSTRRGQALQCGRDTATATLAAPDLPDSYVRCGGGPERPVAVYTLHTMDANGGNLCAISPFEMFEWTPAVSDDGTILYSRWDYIDRHNMPYMSLWSIHPDGSNARLVFGNFTTAPHCTFEPMSVPNSHKIVFTASGHHAQTMGSLVLLDTAVGEEGEAPMTRLTPEVCFPEIEGWPKSFFANPWPLSEDLYLVAWGCESAPSQGMKMAANALGLYVFDAKGSLELLYRDPEISAECPMPLRPRHTPPVLTENVKWDAPKEGNFAVMNVYEGLKAAKPGDIKALRIVAVPAKTQPTMNTPNLGIIGDDPGKCVFGTVPVEEDGSAYFRAPAGVTLFFQALDARGIAVQTMRSVTHVQPGQTQSCTGCHEPRYQAPPGKRPQALSRTASRIRLAPEGAWPMRFDRLVQPVLDAHCVSCHNPVSADPLAARLDLSPGRAWPSLTAYGSPSLAQHVRERYLQGRSVEGSGAAATSPLLAKLNDPAGHHGVSLDAEDWERLIIWLDTCGQRQGSFSPDQERNLLALREQSRGLLEERTPAAINVARMR